MEKASLRGSFELYMSKLFPQRRSACFRLFTAFSQSPEIFYNNLFLSKHLDLYFETYFMVIRQLFIFTDQENDNKKNEFYDSGTRKRPYICKMSENRKSNFIVVERIRVISLTNFSVDTRFELQGLNL